jgi:hypothetical protein
MQSAARGGVGLGNNGGANRDLHFFLLLVLTSPVLTLLVLTSMRTVLGEGCARRQRQDEGGTTRPSSEALFASFRLAHST